MITQKENTITKLSFILLLAKISSVNENERNKTKRVNMYLLQIEIF